MTEPQRLLAEATGMVPEFIQPTKSIRALFPRLPSHYKLDLADPETMVAVEVDGETHRALLAKERDTRKEQALTALGWCVLRCSNREVLMDLPSVTERIATARGRSTTSK